MAASPVLPLYFKHITYKSTPAVSLTACALLLLLLLQDKAWLGQALSSHRKHVAESEAQGFRWLLLDAARNKRVWLVGLAALLKNAAMVGILFWAPIIVNTMLKGGSVDLGATGSAGSIPVHGHRRLHAAQGFAGFSQGAAHPLIEPHTPNMAQMGQGQMLQQPYQGRVLLGLSAGAAAAAEAGSSVRNQTVVVAAAAVQSAAQDGERGVAAVLLTAVPFVCAASCAVWLGHRSQQKKEKCRHVAVPYWIAAVLFLLFPSVASLGSTCAFLCLTVAISSLTAPNAILNSLATSVTQGPSSALGLALYNAVGNLGGLVGPWMIGRVVKATGLYASALQALGGMVALAGILAWHMRRWNV